MDFSSAITTAGSGVTAAATTNIGAIVPILLGVGFVTLVARRVLRFVR